MKAQAGYDVNFIKYEPRYDKAYFLHMQKPKAQISCSVTAQLISAFVFATLIVQSRLFFLQLKFQAFSHLLWLYNPVCVRPGRKPRRPVFSQRGSIMMFVMAVDGVTSFLHFNNNNNNNNNVFIFRGLHIKQNILI